MRVIHVAPTPFGPHGLLGGGERYPLELARALAREVDCELISFGPRRERWREPGGVRRGTLRGVPRPGGGAQAGRAAAAHAAGRRPPRRPPRPPAGGRPGAGAGGRRPRPHPPP